MTTKEVIYQVFERNKNADFQVVLEGNPFASDHIYVNVDKGEPKEYLERILNKFGEQEWAKIEFEGHFPTYCPEEIAEELRRVKRDMYEYFRHNCD